MFMMPKMGPASTATTIAERQTEAEWRFTIQITDTDWANVTLANSITDHCIIDEK